MHWIVLRRVNKRAGAQQVAPDRGNQRRFSGLTQRTPRSLRTSHNNAFPTPSPAYLGSSLAACRTWLRIRRRDLFKPKCDSGRLGVLASVLCRRPVGLMSYGRGLADFSPFWPHFFCAGSDLSARGLGFEHEEPFKIITQTNQSPFERYFLQPS